MNNLKSIFEYKCDIEKLNLDFDAIYRHFKRLLDYKNIKKFKIISNCSIKEMGIFDIKNLNLDHVNIKKDTIALVPAAGASSRYLDVFYELKNNIKSLDKKKINDSIYNLKKLKIPSWAFPIKIKNLLENNFDYEKDEILKIFNQPKALFPCDKNGNSFLISKSIDHNNIISFLSSQVFIAPIGFKNLFEKEILLHKTNNLKTQFFEQSDNLYTIRFKKDLSPYMTKNKKLSKVPGGHGEIVKLIPDIAKKNPEAKKFFIRNIDNIGEYSKETMEEIVKFFKFYEFLFEKINCIRKLLKENNFTKAQSLSSDILDYLKIKQSDKSSLIDLQLNFFHSNIDKDLSEDEVLKIIKKLYDRPLNIMGQVLKNSKDQGGMPVFINFENKKIKICLENSHINQEKISSCNEFFNPVFVIAEIPNDIYYYQKFDLPFWIIANKKYQKTEVLYHESLLYEILGNSDICNLVFVSISRNLFNPTKHITDLK
jgi:hypothetical protein